MAFMQGDTPISSKLLTIVMIDAKTAEPVAVRKAPWYVSALMLSQPLHFGDYGGMGLKLVWAALDLLTIMVLVTGLALWWKRRKMSAGQRLRAIGAAG